MTDGDALLAAVIAHPDEDTPRLVYADWLDENAGPHGCDSCKGHGRVYSPDYEESHPCGLCCGLGTVYDHRAAQAEFIRWQIGVGVAFMRDTEGRWRYDRRRVGLVPDGCWQQLNHFLGEPIPRPFVVRRGFLDEVACTAADWRTHGGTLCREYPIERVTLRDAVEEDMEVLGGWVIRRGVVGNTLFDLLPASRESSPAEANVGYPILWDHDAGRLLALLYLTPGRAEAAMSAACVRYGREGRTLPAEGVKG